MLTDVKKCGIHIYAGQLMLLAVLSAGWWGLLYPDLGLTQETFAVSAPEKAGGELQESANGGQTRREAFYAMLEQPEKIEIKSRLLEAARDIRGKKDEQQRTDRGFRFGSGRTDSSTGDYAPDSK